MFSQNHIAFIDWACLGFPKCCIVGYSFTWQMVCNSIYCEKAYMKLARWFGNSVHCGCHGWLLSCLKCLFICRKKTSEEICTTACQASNRETARVTGLCFLHWEGMATSRPFRETWYQNIGSLCKLHSTAIPCCNKHYNGFFQCGYVNIRKNNSLIVLVDWVHEFELESSRIFLLSYGKGLHVAQLFCTFYTFFDM